MICVGCMAYGVRYAPITVLALHGGRHTGDACENEREV